MSRPEIGKSVKTGRFTTNYLESGEDKGGTPLLFIHGSGPGVSAYANWRLILPKVGEKYHAYAMDMVGFGYSDKPVNGEDGVKYGRELWTKQIIDFMDALELEKVILVGNSFGGSLAISVTLENPDRIEKLIMMGAMGVQSEIPDGLDYAWGYTPSFENMEALVNKFAYDKKYASEELIQTRYEASLEPGFQEAFGSMFPAPRQASQDDLSFPDETISTIQQDTLVVHGRDDEIIPIENSNRLVQLIPNADLHVFSKCGHWVQIEKADEFAQLVMEFIEEKI